jgi:hypothetical protein
MLHLCGFGEILSPMTNDRTPRRPSERGDQMTTDQDQINTAITIRRMDLTDAGVAALDHLAELDSRARLQGPVLGIEIEGRLVAAISLQTGELSADPFSHTSELRGLLELRAAQLREDRRRPSRVRGRRSRRSRLALGGSPAGQIIAMPRIQ